MNGVLLRKWLPEPNHTNHIGCCCCEGLLSGMPTRRNLDRDRINELL